jgi:hypothetical protein
MKCERCDATRHTVGEIRGCLGCQDGTAQQIPADIPDAAPISAAIAVKEGIGNRFKVGGDAPPQDPEITHPGPTHGTAKATKKKKQ